MSRINRRRALKDLTLLAVAANAFSVTAGEPKSGWRLATFSADVTPPLGHPLLGGSSPPAAVIDDPLYAKGFVLLGSDLPVVLVSIDWCEIRNDAYDRWCSVLSEAVGTKPERIMLTCVHQHDAPIADLEAQRILRTAGILPGCIDLEFHESAVQRVANALRESLSTARPVTHYGIGQARVEEVASNRRFLTANGRPKHSRTSKMPAGYAKEQPEGTIDPWLKTLSFWNNDAPLAAISAYAVHPMSYYRTGRVTADFPGLARARRQSDLPDVAQIYVSGASGNVIAGKYNDGSPQARRDLTDRLYRAMTLAWEDSQRIPLEQVKFRTAPLQLPVREFDMEKLKQQIAPNRKALDQLLAALTISWLDRVSAGRGLIVPALDLGKVQLLLLPAESYVEFQLMAQQMRPDSFVMTAGYGECGPGCIAPERFRDEDDDNLKLWCWVGAGCEPPMRDAMRAALGASSN